MEVRRTDWLVIAAADGIARSVVGRKSLLASAIREVNARVFPKERAHHILQWSILVQRDLVDLIDRVEIFGD